jgi:hypothetical protein
VHYANLPAGHTFGIKSFMQTVILFQKRTMQIGQYDVMANVTGSHEGGFKAGVTRKCLVVGYRISAFLPAPSSPWRLYEGTTPYCRKSASRLSSVATSCGINIMRVSKGLEFLMVTLPGMRHMT